MTLKLRPSSPTLFIAALICAGWLGYAQGKKAAGPKGEVVRSENDRVRVVEYNLIPGVAMGMHDHPRDRVEITLTSSRVRVTTAEGNASEVDEKEGSVTWSAASAARHDVVNIGKTPLRAFHVELK